MDVRIRRYHKYISNESIDIPTKVGDENEQKTERPETSLLPEL